MTRNWNIPTGPGGGAASSVSPIEIDDADLTMDLATHPQGQVVFYQRDLSADRTVTLDDTNIVSGTTWTIVRRHQSEEFLLLVTDGGLGGDDLVFLRPGEWVTVVYTDNEFIIQAAGRELPTFGDYMEVQHNSAVEDATLTTSDATYEWTELAHYTTAPGDQFAEWEDAADDVLTIVKPGKYQMDLSLVVMSGDATLGFQAIAFMEIDVGGVGSWAYVPCSLCTGSLFGDVGNEESKATLNKTFIVDAAPGDLFRVRIRKSDLTAAVLTDGGNGNVWRITKVT